MDELETILVVDDEEDIRRLLARALRRAGYRVATAEDGLQALDLLRNTPCTLVITDLRMPGMDGLALLRQIGERHPGIRGIILTGYGTIQSAVEATKLGADNYITKPVVIDELVRAVRTALRDGQALRDRTATISEVSAIAALTRLLAQPAPDLHQVVQDSVDLLAPALRASARLSIVDLLSGREIASAQAEGAPELLGHHHAQPGGPRAGQHILNVSLEPNLGCGGQLTAWRPPDAAPFTAADAQFLQLVASQLSIALRGALVSSSPSLTRWELRELSLQTVHALVRAVEMRDRYTAGHSARVSRYAVALARSLGLTAAEVENIRMAALLHDVGKIGISDLLLNKPGPLTPAERARIQEHPALGCQIVAGVQSLNLSIPLIMHHQESYDGQGYPAGLAGEQIPYEARILAIADSFEAITATRAYRQGRSAAEALEILSAGSGRQWDPLLVARWRQIVDRVLAQPEEPPPAANGT